MLKRCSQCCASKPSDTGHFYKRSGQPGLHGVCIACRAENARRPEVRARVRQYRIVNPVRAMLGAAKKRARVQGLAFDLRECDVDMPTHCPVLGLKLTIGAGRRIECSPTLDRVDPSRGYTRDNVWVISWRANRIKNDATLEELYRLVATLEARNIRRLRAA